MWSKREDMVIHRIHPYNAEPAPHALAGHHITPIDTFYSRNHGPVPDIDPTAWRLRVDGLVQMPLVLNLRDLQDQFEHRTVTATLQCAGNRRAALMQVRDIPGEEAWGPGATSTAEWTGVRLADVLSCAGLHADTNHVAFGAPDRCATADSVHSYGSSIPVRKALSPEVMLAWKMNGESLPALHGGPVRVVVPGYIGARSVKWVERVTASVKPSDNYFQETAYRLLPVGGEPGPGLGISLGSVALNSDILMPADGAVVHAGWTEVNGYAYAGDDRGIARVDVSPDQGETWVQAELDDQSSTWTWRLWRTHLNLPEGTTHISVRAWDTTAATQPQLADHAWNPKGYVNNSWGHTTVTAISSDQWPPSSPLRQELLYFDSKRHA